MKKRVFFTILVLACCFFSIYAENLQKTYLMSDEIWQRANRLCIETGNLGPTPTSPTTGAEIKQALERLDYDILSSKQKAEYDYIIKEIDKSYDNGSFSGKFATIDLDAAINYELYLYNHLKDTYNNEFIIPFRDRKPLLDGQLNAYFGDNVYLNLEYMFKDGPQGYRYDSKGNLTSDGGYLFSDFHNAGFLFNVSLDGDVWFFKDSVGEAKNNTFNHQPVKYGGSFGNDYFNFFIGRTRHSFGNGITGNLLIGDNFSFQEVAMLSLFSDIFSYELSVTHFDNVETDVVSGSDRGTQLSGSHQNRVIHRFDFNIINRFRFAINIGAHFVMDSPFDLRMFNPMAIVHNWNNNSESIELHEGDESNNILSFEFEAAIIPRLTLTSQFVLDQMKLPTETDSSVPGAFGALLNLRYTQELKKHHIDYWIEALYTSPYLYLNTKTKDGEKNYDYDHIVGYLYQQNRYAEISYTGHSFGPDTIAFALGTTFMPDDYSYSIDGTILYKVHGENGIEYSYWPNQKDTNRDTSPDGTSPTGIPEHTLLFQIGGDYKITNTFSFYAKAAAIFQWNYHNNKGEQKNSIQSVIGISWKPL